MAWAFSRIYCVSPGHLWDRTWLMRSPVCLCFHLVIIFLISPTKLQQIIVGAVKLLLGFSMKIQVSGWGKSFLHINVICVCSNATEPVSEDINSFCCSSSCSVHCTDFHRDQAVQNSSYFTGCLWALGPTSILSRLKCRSRMHSPCLLGWVPSHSLP